MSKILEVKRDGITTTTVYEDGDAVVNHSSEDAAIEYARSARANIGVDVDHGSDKQVTAQS